MKTLIYFLGPIGFNLIFAVQASAAIGPEEALKIMVENNLEYRIQKQASDLYKTRSTVQKASLLPTLSLQKTSNRDGEFEETSNSTSAVLNYNLFNGGSDLQGIRIANNEFNKSQVDLNNVRFQAQKYALTLLLNALVANEKVNIANNTYLARKELKEIAEEKFSKGMISEAQVTQALVDMENGLAQLHDSRIILAEQLSKMSSLLGEKEFNYQWPWKDLLTNKKIDALLEEKLNLDSVPEYQSLQASKSISEMEITRSKLNFLPSLDFNLSRNKLESRYSSYWDTRAQVTFTIPLFGQLSSYGNYHEKVYTHAQATYKLEEFRRAANVSFENHRLQLKEAYLRLIGRERVLTKIQNLYKEFLIGFKRGKVSYQDLADEQERLNQTKLLALTGMQTFLQTYMAHCHSLGINPLN